VSNVVQSEGWYECQSPYCPSDVFQSVIDRRVNSRPSFRNRPSRHAFDIVGLWETTSRVGIALKAEYYLTSFVTSSLFRDFISMNEPPKNI
jgi:hypothetical protein